MKAINKYFAIIIIAALFTSCGGETVEDIKSQIKSKKEEISQLNKEIVDLQKKLKELDPTIIDSASIVKVEVKKIEAETFSKQIVISGHVEAVKQINIIPEIPGMIQRIYVEEGQYVYAGQTLFSLNTSVMQSQIDELNKRLELATTVYEKQSELWTQNIGSEIQYLQAKNNKESLEESIQTLKFQMGKAVVTAQFSGVVDKINLKEGDMAQGVVMILVSLDKMKVLADVSEAYLSGVNKGDSVKITFPAYDESVYSTIIRTGNLINPESRTFVIEARIENNKGKYKPNLIAEFELTEYSNDNAIIVPSNVVKQDLAGHYFVFVVEKNENGKNAAVKKEVTFDYSSDGQTMISSGLNKDDVVIVKGYDMVSTGTEVIINNTK
jgi:membrane fusion protein, multidrug efflux system